MPHVDELLGVATVAATGLLAAIAVQAVMGDVAGGGSDTRAAAPAARAPAPPGARASVGLPSVDAVARRAARARIEREARLASPRPAKNAQRPPA